MNGRSIFSSVGQSLVALLAALDVLDLDLHVGAAAAADVDVVALQHAPDALVELEQVADADFGGEDLGHKVDSGVVSARQARSR